MKNFDDRDVKILGEYTTRKTGNSLTLTVPATAGVSAGTKYLLALLPDGSLEYRLAEDNPWLDGSFDDIDFRQELESVGDFSDIMPVGKEKFE